MTFYDGSAAPRKKEVKYPGCYLNDKAEAKKEISRRIKDCTVTLNKLHIFFYNSDNTILRKVQIFNAVLRSKLLYGLETMVMNTAELNKLDVYQLKCMRKS